MKATLRILALLLSLATTASVLASCGGADETETDGTTAAVVETVTETESAAIEPDIAKTDYGEDLYLLCYKTTENFYAEERAGNVVTEALYDRQEKLREHLGVDLIASVAPGNHEEYHLAFTNSVKNKDGAVDLFISNAYMAVPGIIEQGYVRDLKTVQALNLDADYWNQDFMDSISILDHYYLGYGDFNIPTTYVFTFNKDMMDKYGDTLNESIYETVYNYRWTIDKMISLANLVYIDQTGDGKTEDDTFGISGQQWIPFIPFLHAANMKLVVQNEKGDYVVSTFTELNAEKNTALVSKLKALAESDCAWFKFRIEDTPVISITTGRTLMQLEETGALSRLLDYDVEFGVLPYPMYDENQKDVGYISLNYDGYIVFPSYTRNENMIAESLEVLSFHSGNVRTAVYEKLLGKQVANAPDDAKMLDIVWDGLCSDFGLTYSTITNYLDDNLYMIPWLTQAHTDKNIASYVKAYEVRANRAIEKYLTRLKMADQRS